MLLYCYVTLTQRHAAQSKSACCRKKNWHANYSLGSVGKVRLPISCGFQSSDVSQLVSFGKGAQYRKSASRAETVLVSSRFELYNSTSQFVWTQRLFPYSGSSDQEETSRNHNCRQVETIRHASNPQGFRFQNVTFFCFIPLHWSYNCWGTRCVKRY